MELLQKVSDQAPTTCENCKQDGLDKILTPIASTKKLSNSAIEVSSAQEKAASKPLTPKREGKWIKDSKGHKVKVGD